MEPYAEGEGMAESQESLRGAIERAERREDVSSVRGDSQERDDKAWDHGDTWLGDWGKWLNYDE